MRTGKSVEIDVDLEFKDFWQAVFWLSVKKLWIIYLIAITISIPLIFIFCYRVLTDQSVRFSPLILFPLLPLFIVFFNQYSIYKSAKIGIESTKGRTRWEFTENGFEVFTPIARSENDWESLEKIEEKSKTFLLYPQKNIFMLIPKRFLKSKAQLDEFRILIEKNLGDRAKLKND